ncbi:MAG: VCBS domain-containing protein [Pseudomonadota bacterium]
MSGKYSTFTVNVTTGEWTYTLDNTRTATQELLGDEVQTERLEVKILGGDTGFITVLVQGSDLSVFGNAQLFVTED